METMAKPARTFSPAALRKARGRRSLAEVGAAVGRTADTVSAYERGIASPQIDVLEAIAQYLGVNVVDLFKAAEQ